ncbi:MAG: HlyD family type I secretion periplasmic adaptor subunit, partial [Vicinamibacterales bacterium]
MTNIALTPRPDVESEFEDRAERAAIRRLALSGALVTAVASLSVAAWMALAPLHGAVIAPGFVKVDTNRKVVQHREGGVVSRIHVRDGMRVTKGGVLLELEDARIDASVEVARTQLDSELVRGARLAAERDGAAAFVLPAELAERSGDARLRDLIAREERLFKVRRASLSAQLDLFDQQIAAIRSELSVRLTRHATDDAAVRLQQEEIDANRALSDQGFVSRTRLLAMERARTDYEARRGENEAEIARARQRIAELQLKALSLRAGYVDQAAGELKETTARIYDLRERLRPVEDAARRQKIVAPASGLVVALAVSTVGAVVSAGETLLEIVPDDPRLVVEALVRPEDIAGVEV